MRLLIVEDEQQTRNGLLNLPWLSIGITDVCVEADGMKALSVLKTTAIDILLSDIRMPIFSGLDLAEYIYRNKLDTKVILLSGYSDFEFAQRAIKYRVLEYLLKPIKPDVILHAISNAVQLIENEKSLGILADQQSNQTENFKVRIDFGDKFGKSNNNVSRTINEICTSYQDSISLTSVSQKLHFSPAYLSRLIKKETGFAFSDFLNSARLFAAKEYLNNTDLPIITICYKAGYQDHRYFSQLFKKVFGQSPTDYRKCPTDIYASACELLKKYPYKNNVRNSK